MHHAQYDHLLLGNLSFGENITRKASYFRLIFKQRNSTGNIDIVNG